MADLAPIFDPYGESGDNGAAHVMRTTPALLASPTTTMIADKKTIWQRNVAPFDRWVSNGTALMNIPVTDGISLYGPAGNPVSVGGATTAASTSRALTAADNGKTIECTATLSLTLPAGLGTAFGFALIVDSGVTVSIVSSGGVLLNGATTTVTRAAAANTMFAVVSKATADSYAVTGS